MSSRRRSSGTSEQSILGNMARTVSHEECSMIIRVCHQIQRPLFIKGPPAIGKSDLVRQVAMKLAEEAGLEYVEYKDNPSAINDPTKFVLIDLRLAQLDPSDLRGIPWVYALIKTNDGLIEEVPIAIDEDEFESVEVEKNPELHTPGEHKEYEVKTIPKLPPDKDGEQIKRHKILKVPVSVLQQYPDAEIIELVTRWSPPSDLPVAGSGIIFLDEMNLAAELNLKAAYQLILRRCLGEYRVPKGYSIFAAGNRMEDMASVTPMPSPLKSRFLWVTLRSPSVEAWTEWAGTAGIHPWVIGYINFKAVALNQFDPNAMGVDAQPTPRTWEFVSDILNEIGTDDLNMVRLMVSTAVGLEVANEFHNFIQMREQLPPIESYLKDPMGTRIDFRNTSIVWTLLSALAERYRASKYDNKILNPCLQFCLRLTTDEAARSEMAVVFLTMLRAVDPNLKNRISRNKIFHQISDNLVLFVGKEFS